MTQTAQWRVSAFELRTERATTVSKRRETKMPMKAISG
jgi:hypothetical protein